jgi:ABC-type lipoprotein export system ATPase subunit
MMKENNQKVLEADHLVKIYRRGSEEIAAVNDVSLSVKEGEFVAFVGPSGSGKTTLINILGCLDNPSSGRLALAGRTVVDHARLYPRPLSQRSGGRSSGISFRSSTSFPH